MNKERYFAEQDIIGRGWVVGHKRSSSLLKSLAVVRNKSSDKMKIIHDKVAAKHICNHYLD